MRLPDWSRVDTARIDAIVIRHRALVIAALLFACVGTWVAIGASAWYVYAAAKTLPRGDGLHAAGSLSQATTIVDVKGRHAFAIYDEQRLRVTLSEVSPNLIAAVLAIEDRRFYSHEGLDVVRIAGATVNNVVRHRAEQGGSTITQQLARLTFLTTEKTLRRKLQEVILAARLERMYTKDQILELYLNKAYFGDGLHGVEAAALGYFGKRTADVSVAEAALLAGLLKSPSTYAPTLDPKRAVTRRNVVLHAMHEAGAIDEEALGAALDTPLLLHDALRRQDDSGQYFKEEVRKQLIDIFGRDMVYRGGLRVEATINLDLQKAAEAEVAAALTEIEQRSSRNRGHVDAANPLQAALIAIDPRSGEVRAMVGGRDFARSSFNRATQSWRQPGSAFKPFVYAAALEQGFTATTLLTGLNEPLPTVRGVYLPDDDHLEGDMLTMRMALQTSSNRAAVRMLEAVGIDDVVERAGRFGFGDVPRVPSAALGSGEVTLQSLTAAFGAFADAGRLARPALIRRVTSAAGAVLYQARPVTKAAVSPATAFVMTSMLRDVIDAGTGAEARRIGFRLPAAGKTGTTNGYRDAWFVGYTPHIVTGVWVGHDQPRTIMRGGYAAQVAVPLWARFMMTATRGDEPDWFRIPSGVTVREIDRLSGRLATDDCRRAGAGTVHTEYFVEGTAPIDVCPLHRSNILRALAVVPGRPAQMRPPTDMPNERGTTVAPAILATSPADAKPPASAKKRGFWSRVFGFGRDSRKGDAGTPVQQPSQTHSD